MVRQNDPFWDYIEKLDDGRLQCTFCGDKFAACTSVSRIKWHLSGVKGRGVKICEKVTEDVRDAARSAIDVPPQKKLKTIAGSSNNEVTNAISTSVLQQSPEVRHVEMAEQGEGLPDQGEGLPEQGEAIPQQEECLPELNQDEHRGDSSQPTDPLCLTREICYVCTPSVNNDVIMNDVENMVRVPGQHVMRDSSHEGLRHNGDESRGYVFPTKKLVGGEFEKNKNVIWSWLMNDEASSSMGVYGMGGVGKIALLTHIHNLLLNTRASFHHVFWITVSQDFTISKLQNLIAAEFRVDLSNEDNEKKRAAKLFKELSTKQQWVLILDDLWNYFDFDEVGIPIQVKGCKLILTTRSFEVCRKMVCRKMIKVMVLSRKEAWTLFMETLGHDTTLSKQVEKIAKSIARKCAGLPLAIITMSTTMRGVVDIHDWRNSLRELKESEVRQDDMEYGVFLILRYSYNHLIDLALQQCFLYCSSFPKDSEIDRDYLIGYLIDKGVIKGMNSRQAQFDKGHAMLNKLQNVSLLERGRRYVRMHDLIRDMAIQIQQENSKTIVKAGEKLRELPHAEEWTNNPVKVSLMQNQIEKLPSNHSPRCPDLSTLLLCPQEENNEVYNLAGDAGSIRMAAVQSTEQGVGEGRATSCAEAGNRMENLAGEMRRIDRVNTIEGLIGVAHETREDARQIMEELSQVDVEMAEHGEALSQQGEVYSPGTIEEWMESLTYITDFQLQLGCGSPEGLVLDAPETRPKTEQMHPGCEGRTYDLLPLHTEDNVLENPTRDLMQHFERSTSHERLSINQLQPQEDSSQPPDLLCHGIGRHYDQLCSSSLNNDVTMNDVENMNRGPGQRVRGSSNERLPVNQDEPRRDSSQPTDPLRLTLGRYGDQLLHQ